MVWRIARGDPRHASRIATAVAAAIPVLLVASLGYARRWVTEDAFIDLRIVRHLLAGHGPVFNVGERVEAYTSPLWVALLAAWGAVPAPLELAAVALGLVASLAGVLLAQSAAWTLAASLREHPPTRAQPWLALPLGAAVFAVIPVVWDFVTSGLESGLVVAWLGTAFWLLVRARPLTPRHARLAAFALRCGPLVRPDLALFSAAFAAALAHWPYVTRVGGDFMHGRLLLPSLFGLLLPVATVLVPIPALRGWRGATLAGLALWAAVCALSLRVPYAGAGVPGPWGIADERGFYTHHMGMEHPTRIAHYLRHPFIRGFRANLLTHDGAVVLDRGREGLAVASALAPSVADSVRLVVGLSNVGVLG